MSSQRGAGSSRPSRRNVRESSDDDVHSDPPAESRFSSSSSSSSSRSERQAGGHFLKRKQVIRLLQMGTALCLLSIAATYLVRSRDVPYCDCPTPSGALAPRDRRCIPCPPNATCTHGRFKCNRGFVPTWRGCVLNFELLQLQSAIEKDIVHRVRNQAGYVACGELPGDDACSSELHDGAHAPGCFQSDLQKILARVYRNEALFFSDAFKQAIARLSAPDLASENDENALHFSGEYIVSEHPQKPAACQVREFAWQIWSAVSFYIQLALITAVVYVAAVVYLDYKAAHAENTKLLVSQIRQALEEQSRQDPDSGIAIAHLRDDLIPIHERGRLSKSWDEAVRVISKDSRVQQESVEIGGFHNPVWKWKSTIKSPVSSPQFHSHRRNFPDSSHHSPSSPSSNVKSIYPSLGGL